MVFYAHILRAYLLHIYKCLKKSKKILIKTKGIENIMLCQRYILFNFS